MKLWARLKEEVRVLFFLGGAMALWLVFFLWGVRFLKSFILTAAGDFSYLWDAPGPSAGGLFLAGGLGALALYFWLLAIDLYRGRRRRKIFAGPGVWKNLGWDIGLLTGLMIACFFLFTGLHSHFAALKEQYFARIIAEDSRYKRLSPAQKEKALLQFRLSAGDAALEGMVHYYGTRLRILQACRVLAFWGFVWGIPFYVTASLCRRAYPSAGPGGMNRRAGPRQTHLLPSA